MSSSFHHLLLKGEGHFRGVVSSIACFMVLVKLVENWSSCVGVVQSGSIVSGRYSLSFVSSNFHFVFS